MAKIPQRYSVHIQVIALIVILTTAAIDPHPLLFYAVNMVALSSIISTIESVRNVLLRINPVENDVVPPDNLV